MFFDAARDRPLSHQTLGYHREVESDGARPACLRFGDVIVDRGAMLVTRNGERVDLEPKAFDVLLHLTERQGQLVTKSELIAAVWNGVAVTDHVLTRVVGQLRRGLGDAAREARYIETVPTRGYRFIARVETIARDAPAPAPAAASSPAVRHEAPAVAEGPRSRSRWPRVAVALVAAALAALGGAWAWTRTTVSRAEWTGLPPGPRQLSFSQALDAYPAFSPDGRLLAYASSASGAFEIEVRALTPDARARPVTSDRGGNIQPDWSPDGQYLAYHSVALGGVWVVPAMGGVARRVAAVGAGPAWSPQGRDLVFQSSEPATVESGGTPPPSLLWMVAADGGAPRQLTHSGAPAGGHTEPVWSPDGRRVTFLVRSVGRAEIWSIPSAGGESRFVWSCSGVCSRVAYEPSGRALIFWQLGQGYLRLPIDPATGATAGDPVLLVSQRADFPGHITISPDGRTAAFTDLTVRSNLYAVPIDASGNATGPSRAVTKTTGRDMSPAFSPDGRQIAFAARRESTQICLVSPAGGDITPLPIPPGFDGASWPGWGGGRVMGVAFGDKGAAVISIDPVSRETRIVTSLGPGNVTTNSQFLAPRFFADGQRVIFSREIGGAVSVWTMDLATRQAKQLTPVTESAVFPTPSPDGRWIAYERVIDGSMHVVVMPVDGGPGRQLTSGRGLTWPHSWSADNSRLFTAMRRGTSWSIGSLSVATGETTVLTTASSPHTYLRYPSVSPSGDQVVYEQTETTGNIWQVSLWTQVTRGTR
jgi:Tol biopolymer transport system component/DNA-binding winged helix-turn-helix (wHTH) protein